jgi:hypothetical protein
MTELPEIHRVDLDSNTDNILYLVQKIPPQNSRESKIVWVVRFSTSGFLGTFQKSRENR